jgi:hypothetical protein
MCHAMPCRRRCTRAVALLLLLHAGLRCMLHVARFSVARCMSCAAHTARCASACIAASAYCRSLRCGCGVSRSITALSELCGLPSAETPGWLAALEATRWLDHQVRSGPVRSGPVRSVGNAAYVASV